MTWQTVVGDGKGGGLVERGPPPTGEGRHETCPYGGGRGDWTPPPPRLWIPDCSGITEGEGMDSRSGSGITERVGGGVSSLQGPELEHGAMINTNTSVANKVTAQALFRVMMLSLNTQWTFLMSSRRIKRRLYPITGLHFTTDNMTPTPSVPKVDGHNACR